MRFGMCGHPLRGGECEEGTPIECDHCTVCFLLEMDSQAVRWDDEEHNNSDLDGESISCILHAEAWNEYHGGREDEANAWGGLVGGGSMYTIEDMRAFEEQGRQQSHEGTVRAEVPAWNEPRAVTFLRGLPPNLIAGDVERWRAMVATPEQVVAWEDSDGRILFDTVNTRGAVDARWVNEPGATPRPPDDEE